MPEDMDKKGDQFGNLIEIMEKTPRRSAPDGFTEKVMARLSAEKEARRSFSLSGLFPTRLDFGFPGYVTRTECAFYFLLTAFFYFILGAIMMIGFPLPEIMRNNVWLSLQPLLGILLAAELAAIGFTLYKRGDSAAGLVRAGVILYAALIIINCALGAFYVNFSLAVISTIIFSISGLMIAFLLGTAVERCYPETIFSEARG
jgi:hypothetical protein